MIFEFFQIIISVIPHIKTIIFILDSNLPLNQVRKVKTNSALGQCLLFPPCSSSLFSIPSIHAYTRFLHTYPQCIEFQQLNYPTIPSRCVSSPVLSILFLVSLVSTIRVPHYSLGNMIMMSPSYFDLTRTYLPFLELEIHSCFSSVRFSMVDPVLLPLFSSSSLSFLSIS